jgi:hypothetical protein
MSDSYIRFEVLKQQKNLRKTEYFSIAHFEQPITIRMDGKQRISVITWNREK